jgi:hypothetical protein
MKTGQYQSTSPSQAMATRSRRRVQQARAVEEAEAAVVESPPDIMADNNSNSNYNPLASPRLASGGADPVMNSRVISSPPQHKRENDSLTAPGSARNRAVEEEIEERTNTWLRNCPNALAYLDACEKYDIKIDPNVVICLQTHWSILQPSYQFVEGSLLPLLGVLEMNDHVTKANFSNAGMKDARFRFSGNGNSNARLLRYILSKNKCIQELNLSNTGLDDDGVNEIAEGIKESRTLVSLNLSSNHFGEIGAERLRLALEQNDSIKQIDLSQNALGFRSINSIMCSCSHKNIIIQTHGNFVFEEILNSVSHGIAFLASVVGANLLLQSAANCKNYSDYHFWACVLYSGALMFLFLSSCLFHSFFMMPHGT